MVPNKVYLQLSSIRGVRVTMGMDTTGTLLKLICPENLGMPLSCYRLDNYADI